MADNVKIIDGLRVIKDKNKKPALVKALKKRNNDKLILKYFPGLKTKQGKINKGKFNSYYEAMILYAKGVSKVAVTDFNVRSYSSLPAGIDIKKSTFTGKPSKTYFGDKFLTYAKVNPKSYLSR